MAAFGVLLEDFDGDFEFFEVFGDFDTDLLAAEDEDAFEAFLLVEAHEAEEGGEVLVAGDDIDVVFGLKAFSAVGDDDLGATEDHGDEGVFGGAAADEFFEGGAGEPGIAFNGEADEFDFAAGEFDDIGDAGEGEDGEEAGGEFGFWVDDEVDVEAGILADAAPVVDFVGAEAGDFDADAELGLGDEAGEEVNLIAGGDGDEHVGGLEAGGFQRFVGGAVAADDVGVEGFFEAVAAILVFFDEGDFVAFAGEAAGDEGADVAAPHDEDTHIRDGTWRGGVWFERG